MFRGAWMEQNLELRREIRLQQRKKECREHIAKLNRMLAGELIVLGLLVLALIVSIAWY